MKPSLFVALAVALLPLPALGNAVVHVVCADECPKVEIDGKRGEKINEKEWRFDKIPAGLWEVWVRGRQEGGWIDLPAEGEVELQISRQPMLVNGQPCLDKNARKELEKSRREAADAAKKAERELKDQEKKAAEAEKRAERDRKEQEKRDKEQAERDRKEQEKQAERDRRDQEKREKQASGSSTAAAKVKTKMAVVGLVGKGMEQNTADLFSDALVGELRRRPGLQVTDRSDIATVLGAEREKQLLGCSDNACMAEVGGALGVDLLVRGNVGRVGKILQVFLVMVDSKKGVAVATVSEQIKSGADEAFFEKVPKFVDQLLQGRK